MLDNHALHQSATEVPMDPIPLLRIANRSATRVLRNPVLAEEAGERAVHQLILCCLRGEAPDRPATWVRVVARNFALAIRRSPWARHLRLDEDRAFARDHHPELLPGPDPWHAAADHLLGRIACHLTARQGAALAAARANATSLAAARSCGMNKRDFRRQLANIGRQGRKTLQLEPELQGLRNGLLGDFPH